MDRLHKRYDTIINTSQYDKYPELEKAAQIMVPINNVRDYSIINNLKKNEKKIRFICNDNDALMKEINRMNEEHKLMKSNSQTLLKLRLKKIKF